MKTLIITFLSLSLFISCNNHQKKIESNNIPTFHESSIIGKYTDGFTNLLEIKREYNKLFIEPSFNRGIYVLDISNIDNIISTEIFSGTENTLYFEKDNNEIITGLIWNKKVLKKVSKINSPIEHLLSGDQKTGIEGYIKNIDKINLNEIFDIGEYILDSLPSKTKVAKSLFDVYTHSRPTDAKGFYNLGRAEMILKQRNAAKVAFTKSLGFGSKNVSQIVNHLSVIDKNLNIQSNINIDFKALFSPPNSKEISNIKKKWTSIDLHPKKFQIELDTAFIDNNFKGRMKVLSYHLNEQKKYGAIFIPDTLPSLALPAIVESKGIDSKYFGIDLSYLPKLSGYLNNYSNRFIYIIPSVRGENMTFFNYSFLSDGLPNDGWDGATEDYLAFFNVAVDYLGNKLDLSKIIAFGDSRGGTTAMLASIRDNRFSALINWAGPIDWINHMNGYDGHSLKEQVINGITKRILPDSGTPGQFIDWYFSKESNFNQEEIRHKIIASSPLYFLDQLPNSIISHYAKEDLQIPIQNGYRLQKELQYLKNPKPNISFYFHENIGHNLNPYEAILTTRDFIIKHCFKSKSK